jgi:hypothetical protein
MAKSSIFLPIEIKFLSPINKLVAVIGSAEPLFGRERQHQKEGERMKRVMVLMLAAVFLFSGAAFAAEVKDKSGAVVQDKTGKAVESKTIKEAPPKVTKMKATGTVLAISDSALKLERELKGKKETMDFSLVKAYPEVKTGDKVNVTYVAKDGKNAAEKVSKVKVKEPKAPAPKKPAQPTSAVKDKTGADVKDKSGAKVESKK